MQPLLSLSSLSVASTSSSPRFSSTLLSPSQWFCVRCQHWTFSAKSNGLSQSSSSSPFLLLKTTDLPPLPELSPFSASVTLYSDSASTLLLVLFFSCTGFSELHTHVSKWPQKENLAKRWKRNVQGDRRRTPKCPMSQKPRNKQVLGRRRVSTKSNNSE